jgi:hypothetical protein
LKDNDLNSGQVIYKLLSGDEYVAQWDEGKQYGQGTATFTNFVSDLSSCPNSGYLDKCLGTHKSYNGNIYIGEFSNGIPYGKGIFINANRTKLAGQVRDGRISGKISIIHPDGNKNVGEFKNGKFVVK